MKPQIINYYIMNMDRTYMYFRISATESVICYYLLSLEGTQNPNSPLDIRIPSYRKDHNRLTDVFE